ncbi:hypothetical protein E3P99_00923 [Wallemia hederae]|uniref:Uncharacterized protein n=1 Tax=Wallemia hederae TaxID=1540922 RepID=A0A4T0FVI3_9BASI|nr:hypothetical protein E3P99_00923 [Wallemia hederae]
MERIERRSLVDVVDASIIDTADKFCRIARKATKPGGSHELKVGLTAVPWVCTMLAAEHHGLHSQFDENVALSRSATRPKDFKIVVDTCKAVLSANDKPKETAENAMATIPITAEELVQEYELPSSRADDVKELMKAFYKGAETDRQQLYLENTRGPYRNELIGALFWAMGASLNILDLPSRNQFASDWQLTVHVLKKYCEDVDYYTRDELDSLRRTGKLMEKSSPKRELGLEQSLTTNTKRRRNAAERADVKRTQPEAGAPRRMRSTGANSANSANDALKDLQSRRTTPQKPRTIHSTPQKTTKTQPAEQNQTPRQAAARAKRQQRLETVKENDNGMSTSSLPNNLLLHGWCFTDTFKSSYQPSRYDEFLEVRKSLLKSLKL